MRQLAQNIVQWNIHIEEYSQHPCSTTKQGDKLFSVPNYPKEIEIHFHYDKWTISFIFWNAFTHQAFVTSGHTLHSQWVD